MITRILNKVNMERSHEEQKRKFFENPLISKWIPSAAAIVLLLAVSFFVIYQVGWFGLLPGKIMAKDICATRTYRIRDQEKIDQKKAQELQKYPLCCLRNEAKYNELKEKFKKFFTELSDSAVSNETSAVHNLKIGIQSNPDWAAYFASLTEEQKTAFHAGQIHKMDAGILPENFDCKGRTHIAVRFGENGESVNSSRPAESLSPKEVAEQLSLLIAGGYEKPDRKNLTAALNKSFYSLICEGNIEPDTVNDEQQNSMFNIRFSKDLTKALKEELDPNQLLPANEYKLTRLYSKGDVIVKKGEILSHEKYDILRDREKLGFQWEIYLKYCFLTALLLLLLAGYCKHAGMNIARNTSALWAVSLLTSASMLLILLYNDYIFPKFFDLSGLPQVDMSFLYSPTALITAVIAVIYGLRISVLAGFYAVFVYTVALLDKPYPAFMLMCTGMAAVLCTGCRVQYSPDFKKYFIRTFLTVFAVLALSGIICNFGSLFNAFSAEEIRTAAAHVLKQEQRGLGKIFGMAAAGAAFTVIFAGILIVLAEFLSSKITSNMTYLSFTDRNHELLKRLQSEAPGTYYHCERAALLANNAAMLIHCNPWKIQACQLFHDVGKLIQPKIFTENAGGADTLQDLPPEVAAASLKEHVSYGLELAQKYRLRGEIRDAILSHHGTSFVSFFYSKAMEQNPDMPPDERLFRYDGPLPVSKEHSILMLADSCEAATHSINIPDEDAIRKRVESVFSGKIQQGQMNESLLSIRELNIIRESFVDTIVSMNHIRVAYPSAKKIKTLKG